MTRIAPNCRPLSDCPNGAAVAGSAFWRFETAQVDGATLPTGKIDPTLLQRLSVSRPHVCGLTLDRPRVMGILNVTPDSFSDGGDHVDLGRLVERAQAMAQDADILDIGGESTRPGAMDVDLSEELNRVIPAIRALRAAGIQTPISIDTRKAAVAEAALLAGANMVNDVSALTYDPAMARVVAQAGVPVCLMHAQGDPRTMQADPQYGNVVNDVFDYLKTRIQVAENAGILPENIIADPGIGFGKTLQHNVTVLRGISHYHDLGVALLLGASRKRFIGTLGAAADPKDRVAGSVAVALHASSQGLHILRVHDTKETRQALNLQLAIAGDA